MTAASPRHVGARHWLGFLEEALAGSALVVVVLSTCWGVLTRYVTSQPAAWSGEVAAIAFAWMVFVGAAAGFKYGMHVTIDVVVARLPAASRRRLTVMADSLVLVFLGTLFALSVEFAIDAWSDPTSVLRLPRSITYASVVVGSLCMLGRYWQVARRRRAGLPGAWCSPDGDRSGDG
ncbi:MAG: TRAP transporter small permease [Lautropia sp.]